MRSLPSLRRHKASGKAVVTLVDKTTKRRTDVYLGDHGPPDARAEYDRVIAAWLESGRAVEWSERQAEAEASAPAVESVIVKTVLVGSTAR
jgi:hypothetical protein